MVTPTFAGFNVGPGTGRNNNMGYANGDYYNIKQTVNNILLNAYVAYSPIENLTIKGTGAIRSRSTGQSIFNKKKLKTFSLMAHLTLPLIQTETEVMKILSFSLKPIS